MREVQINRNLILREDGRLFNIHTGEEYIPPICNHYYVVAIKHITKRVHRLVMEYFGPPQPSPEYQVDHINRNTLDNRLENLRWVTCKENQNNRKNNLPMGQRRCDINDDKLYYYLRTKENGRKNYIKNVETRRQQGRDYYYEHHDEVLEKRRNKRRARRSKK